MLGGRKRLRGRGNAFDESPCVEWLRTHLEPPCFAAGEREQIAQVGVEEQRRPTYLVVSHAPVPHLENVEGRDDALQWRAEFVADLAEKSTSSDDEVVHRGHLRTLLFDGADVVDATDEGGEERWHEE